MQTGMSMNFEWLFVDMQLFEFWSVVMVPLASGASLVSWSLVSLGGLGCLLRSSW